MRILLYILLMVNGMTMLSQTTSGYVLTNTDGTLRVSDNAVTIAKINGLQAILDARVPTTRTINGNPLSGNVSITAISGNAGTATTLETARTIQGVSFDGSANINIINGTGFIKASGATLSYDNATYQPLATNLTSIGGLANVSGFLKNDGAGNFSYDNPAGSGTVTNMSIVSANGISGSVATSTSTPAVTLTLGAITPTTVNGHTFTTGTSTFTGTAGQTYTFPAVTSTLLPNTTTSGVSASPTASSTTTVTHGLGRIPTTIRIYGIGAFVNSTSATPTPFSMGVFNSSGNRCVYMTSNGTTAQASQTSTVFAVFLATSAGNTVSGVIQNVTSTGFDIVWTETGTSAAQNFLWEAQ